ncbi:hypothetical protein Dsin_027460 [Dipteronia sinensis]|uniref:DUF4283 domain-containing protein n=1 Tax=Dipteronia sinensis TaxID=43782 RepID=A0AAE0DTN3_9ROSI|nr:hypothetical protein Dsin_027460 [Dipteronia sinensis]
MDSEVIARLCVSLSLVDSEGLVRKLDESLKEAAMEKMQLSLVERVLSKKSVNREAFMKVISKIWKLRHALVVESVTVNTFTFHFEKEEDLLRVLSGERWSFDNALLVLKKLVGQALDPMIGAVCTEITSKNVLTAELQSADINVDEESIGTVNSELRFPTKDSLEKMEFDMKGPSANTGVGRSNWVRIPKPNRFGEILTHSFLQRGKRKGDGEEFDGFVRRRKTIVELCPTAILDASGAEINSDVGVAPPSSSAMVGTPLASMSSGSRTNDSRVTISSRSEGLTNGCGGSYPRNIGRSVSTGMPPLIKIFSWNAWGLGNARAFNVLLTHKREANPELMLLMEPRCDHSKLEKWRVKLGFSSKLVVNSVGNSGRLCLFWSDTVVVELLSFSLAHIDVKVRSGGDRYWRFTGFYGHLDHDQMVHSWTILRRIAGMLEWLWVCIRDFNEILYDFEKLGGLQKNQRHVAAFREALEDCDLDDMVFIGPKFTRCNKQKGDKIILERLDRGTCNRAWAIVFPDYLILALGLLGVVPSSSFPRI